MGYFYCSFYWQCRSGGGRRLIQLEFCTLLNIFLKWCLVLRANPVAKRATPGKIFAHHQQKNYHFLNAVKYILPPPQIIANPGCFSPPPFSTLYGYGPAASLLIVVAIRLFCTFIPSLGFKLMTWAKLHHTAGIACRQFWAKPVPPTW